MAWNKGLLLWAPPARLNNFCRHLSNTYCQFQKFGPDLILPSSEFRAWEPEAAVRLRLQESGPQAMQPLSVPTFFRNQVERVPDGRALWSRDRSGEDLFWTWTQYHEEVSAAAKGFIELGLEPFHTVAILGHNDPAWHISNLAAIHAGGFATGIYQTNTAAASEYIARDSRANIVVVGDQEQLAKVLSIRASLPHLRAVVLYGKEPAQNMEQSGVFTWQQLLQLGRDKHNSTLDSRLNNIALNQCCILTYTSGTTGDPKGTMLSHDSVTYISRQNTAIFNWSYGTESVLSYLPLSHIAGQMFEIYMVMAQGGTACFADRNALKGTLRENFVYYRPTRILGVTRVFEKIEEGLKAMAATSGLKKKLVDWAKSEALAHHAAEEQGVPHTSLGYRLAQRLILSKVHQALGMDRAWVNGYAIGGAAVSPETVRYFLSLDMKLLEMISSTESCGLAQITNVMDPGKFRVGKVGQAYQDSMEVMLMDKDDTGAGELLTRGRANCMGYLNKKEKTLEALDSEGWLHSGDLLREDSEGFFTVVGRIKEIIITAGGENVAPTNIEDEIKKELGEVVSNVMVVGDRKKYLTALLTLKVTVDPVTLAPTDILDPQAQAWVQTVAGDAHVTLKGGKNMSIKDLSSSPIWPQVSSSLQAGLDRANSRAVSNVATIKKWTLLPRDFSVDGGELGPSLKLKRFHVAEVYKETIEDMYKE